MKRLLTRLLPSVAFLFLLTPVNAFAAVGDLGASSVPASFPATIVSQTSGTSMTVTVKHNGGGSAPTLNATPGAPSGVELGGTHSGDFSITGGTCITGSPVSTSGSGCTVTLSFTPLATGDRVATLTLNSDANNNPVVFDVTGTGTLCGGGSEECNIGECCDTTLCQFKAATTVCDDGNDDCLTAQCDGVGSCVPDGGSEPNTTPCDDGNECVATSECQAGSCTPVTFRPNNTPCDDGIECTVGKCDGSGACVNTGSAPDNTSCDDGNDCTKSDCQGGACTFKSNENAGKNCEDGNECTDVAECDGAGVCAQISSQPDGTVCDTGDACDLIQECSTGICTGSSPVVCPAPGECQIIGTCNPVDGDCSAPTNAPVGTPCSGGTCDGSGNCSGTPVPPNQPVVQLNPSTVNFGNVTVDTTSSAEMVTLSNAGGQDLVVGNLSIDVLGSPFSIVAGSDTCSGTTLVAASGGILASCTVQLTAAPTVLGAASANLLVPSNASTSVDSVLLTLVASNSSGGSGGCSLSQVASSGISFSMGYVLLAVGGIFLARRRLS